jgi:hypothetical protein
VDNKKKESPQIIQTAKPFGKLSAVIREHIMEWYSPVHTF